MTSESRSVEKARHRAAFGNCLNHLLVDACIAIAEDNRAVSKTEIHKRLIVGIGDRAAFTAFHEYGVVLTPIAIAVGYAHGHVGVGVFEEEVCDGFS